MRVTFDTNSLDKACRPQRFPKDPSRPAFERVHDGLAAGAVRGFYSLTMLTIEGIMRRDRAAWMAGTENLLEVGECSIMPASAAEQQMFPGVTEVHRIPINIKVKQPSPPLPAEVVRRAVAAQQLGIRVLKPPPRIGFRVVNDPTGDFYVSEEERRDLAEWVQRIHEVSEAISDCGVGFAQLVNLGQGLAATSEPEAIWFKALSLANDVHQRRAVERAFGEWADGDSIAAHVAYGMDVFCTSDEGKSNAGPSVLDKKNREWLTASFGVRFMTIEQLADTL